MGTENVYSIWFRFMQFQTPVSPEEGFRSKSVTLNPKAGPSAHSKVSLRLLHFRFLLQSLREIPASICKSLSCESQTIHRIAACSSEYCQATRSLDFSMRVESEDGDDILAFGQELREEPGSECARVAIIRVFKGRKT